MGSYMEIFEARVLREIYIYIRGLHSVLSGVLPVYYSDDAYTRKCDDGQTDERTDGRTDGRLLLLYPSLLSRGDTQINDIYVYIDLIMIDNLGVLKLECVQILHIDWAKEGGGE
jgi:hypothetical protein